MIPHCQGRGGSASEDLAGAGRGRVNRGSATLGRTRKGPTCSLPGTVFTTPSRETQNVWLTGGSGRGLGALERVLWRGPPLNLPPGNVWPGRVWRELAGSPGEGGVFLGRSPVPTAWAHPLSPFISTSEVRLCPRVPTGPRAGDYTYREGLEHKCKRDILLGRLRSSEDQLCGLLLPVKRWVGCGWGGRHSRGLAPLTPSWALPLITGRRVAIHRG